MPGSAAVTSPTKRGSTATATTPSATADQNGVEAERPDRWRLPGVETNAPIEGVRLVPPATT